MAQAPAPIPYSIQPRRRWPTWLIVLVSLLGSVGLIVAGLVALVGYTVWRNGAILGVDLYNIPIQQAQSIGRFSLPPGALNVQSHLVDWQDFSLRVRFDLPADQEQAFLASTFCKPVDPAQTKFKTFDFVGEEKWWQAPTTGPIEIFEGDNGKVFQKILIDRRDPAKLVVYLVAFDT